jgi:hypothetical protein
MTTTTVNSPESVSKALGKIWSWIKKIPPVYPVFFIIFIVLGILNLSPNCFTAGGTGDR